ncbi:hypothetical protein C8255_23290 [filamentous cyanobacterium CCP3]|nr:hypothetical protein C8255_23290 [filamentous cyanobacterium CCP3]
MAGALKLEGRTLASGWSVIRAIGWDPKTGASKEIYNGTGGNFSKAYLVEKNGRQAFLKAIDLTRPLSSDNIVNALLEALTHHKFEVDILNICSGAKLDRIVVAIDSGEERLSTDLKDVVPYLIFELAEGDVRKTIKEIKPDLKRSWWLRAMHHAAVGLNQLHSKKVAHQDLKPSNILSFGQNDGFKLADLGRSTCETHQGPFDDMMFSGDRTYAPIEILYGYVNPNAFERRRSSDAYMLGSMIFFFGLGLGATPLILSHLPRDNWPPSFPGGWDGPYEDVLPLIEHAFTRAIAQLREAIGDDEISDELVTCARQLCEPNPSERGHPLTRAQVGSNFNLERYVSKFNLLALRSSVRARLDK